MYPSFSNFSVLLKLLSKMNSGELLESILDHIQKKVMMYVCRFFHLIMNTWLFFFNVYNLLLPSKQMLNTENPKDSLPLIVLLGRLVKAFFPMSGILCHNYGKAWNILMIDTKNIDIYVGTSVQKCLSSLLLISLCYQKIYF